MSRYSPQVQPAREEDFGEVLADSILAFAGGMQERNARQQADEDRQRKFKREDEADARTREHEQRQRIIDTLSLYNSGYREGQPPPEAAPASNLADLVAGQRGNMTQGGTAGMAPPPMPRGNTTAQGTVGLAPAPLGMPSRIEQAGKQFYALPGGMGYVDTRATPDARRQQADLENDQRTADRQRADDERTHGYRLDEEARAHGFRSAEDEARYKRDLEIHRMDNASRERVAGIRGPTSRGGGGAVVSDDPADPKTLDKRASMVGQQISGAQRTLDDEGAALGAAEDLGEVGDSTRYHGIAAQIDSLRGVQAGISAARGGDAQAQAAVRRSAAESQLREKRQRLLNMGVDPAKVDAAMAEDLARLGTEYGAPPAQPAAPRWHPPMVRPSGQQPR